jgi:RNA recognition motif-containing protein
MYQPNNNLKRNALFLANLSNECNEGDLYNVFSPFGEIAGIKIIRGQYSNKSTYGFVNFSYQSAANEATRRMNGFMMFGLPLRFHIFVLDFISSNKLCFQHYKQQRATRERNIKLQNNQNRANSHQLHFRSG